MVLLHAQVKMIKFANLAFFIIFVLSACTPESLEIPETPVGEEEEPQPELVPTTEHLLTEVLLQPVNNPQLRKPIQFEYDSVNSTFYVETQAYIPHIDSLRPTFFADGRVFIGKQEVQSDIDPFSFSQRFITLTVVKDEAYRDYTISIRSPQTTGLPVLFLETNNKQAITSKTEYISALCHFDKGSVPIVDDFTPYDTTLEAGIRGRGNSTWYEAKKPYRLHLAHKQPLFGMRPAKSWVLLANALDITLLTNDVAFEIARRIEMPYTCHSQPIEVYINGSYNGSYTLTEPIQVHKARIPADTLNGGFLIEFDTNYDELYRTHTPVYKLPLMMKAPESEAGLSMALAEIRKVERIMQREGFSEYDYNHILDPAALCQFMLVNELVKNVELGHPKSCFAYRMNADSPICFGPVWDFDWAYGYAGGNYRYFGYRDGLLFSRGMNQHTSLGFFSRFLDDGIFYQRYQEEWRKLGNSLADIDEYIYARGEYIQYSWQENQKRWNTPGSLEKQLVRMVSFLHYRQAILATELLSH